MCSLANTLQHTATHCNTLQHPATPCNTCTQMHLQMHLHMHFECTMHNHVKAEFWECVLLCCKLAPQYHSCDLCKCKCTTRKCKCNYKCTVHNDVRAEFWEFVASCPCSTTRTTCEARAVCCSVLQCVAVCCSVLQCVAVCCSTTRTTCENAHAPHAMAIGLILNFWE